MKDETQCYLFLGKIVPMDKCWSRMQVVNAIELNQYQTLIQHYEQIRLPILHLKFPKDEVLILCTSDHGILLFPVNLDGVKTSVYEDGIQPATVEVLETCYKRFLAIQNYEKNRVYSLLQQYENNVGAEDE